MKAVILAGGKGTRMRPITYEVPKSLLRVHNKPLLQHLVEFLHKHEVRDIILSIGYKGEKIREFFKDGPSFGVRIRYVEEKEELGTSGPLTLMNKQLDEPFLMLNGDILVDMNLHDFVESHIHNGGIATMALIRVEDPSRYGVIRIEAGRILEFVEKPLPGKEPSNLINAGIYILDPEVLDYIPKGKSMLEKDVFPKLAEEGKLFGYEFKGQWFDIGIFEDYERAMKEWKDIE